MPATHPVAAPPVPVAQAHGALPAAPQFIDLAYLGSGRPIPRELPSPSADSGAIAIPLAAPSAADTGTC